MERSIIYGLCQIWLGFMVKDRDLFWEVPIMNGILEFGLDRFGLDLMVIEFLGLSSRLGFWKVSSKVWLQYSCWGRASFIHDA